MDEKQNFKVQEWKTNIWKSLATKIEFYLYITSCSVQFGLFGLIQSSLRPFSPIHSLQILKNKIKKC